MSEEKKKSKMFFILLTALILPIAGIAITAYDVFYKQEDNNNDDELARLLTQQLKKIDELEKQITQCQPGSDKEQKLKKQLQGQRQSINKIKKRQSDRIYKKASNFAQKKKNQKALGRLNDAFKKGFRDFAKLKADKNFDHLRDNEKFKNIVAKFRDGKVEKDEGNKKNNKKGRKGKKNKGKKDKS